MNSTQWYSAGLRAIGVLCIISCVVSLIITCLRTKWAFVFRKYILYPQVPHLLRGCSTITIFEAILLILFLAVNVLCVAIGGKGSTVTKRMGLMSVINFVPLALGGHMNIIVSRCRIRPQSYERVHRWVGKVAILEGLLHCVIATASSVAHSPSPSAIVAAVILAVILISSGAFVRRYFYEFFFWLHLILVGVVVTTVWLHTNSGRVLAVPKVYLLTAACLWFLARLLRLGNVVYRNFRYNKLLHPNLLRRIETNSATVMTLPGAFQVCVKLTRPWKFRAGEWMYLTFRELSTTAIFQSHPAVVAWWYRSGGAGDQRSRVGPPDTVVFLVQPRNGITSDHFSLGPFTHNHLTQGDHIPDYFTPGRFTQGLGRVGRVPDWESMRQTEESWQVYGCLCTTIEKPVHLTAFVEGPYGEELELGSYGTVLCFATGIGISAQIANARRYLEKHHEWDSKIQRIALFWEIEAEIHSFWVRHWMNDLLAMDTNHILDIRVFVLGRFLEVSKPSRTQGRLKLIYKALDVQRIIQSEIENRKGPTLVSTCVHKKMTGEIRKVVASDLKKNIRLQVLNFDPWKVTSSRKPPRSLVRQIGHFLRQLL